MPRRSFEARSWVWPAVVASVAIAGPVACGGATASVGSTTTNGDGGAGGGSGSSSYANDPGASNADVDDEASTGGGKPSGGSDGDDQDGFDAGVSFGASPAPPAATAPPSRIHCGDASSTLTCAVGTETCCEDSSAGTGTCMPNAQAGACEDVALACARASDCSGNQICCGVASWDTFKGTYFESASCMSQAACFQLANQSNVYAQLCDPAADHECAGSGTHSGTCAPSHALPGYFTCAYGG